MTKRKTAFLFPGQGSQFVGMGYSFYQSSSQAKRLFNDAEEILGIPLKRLCFEGPLEELTATRVAQPAILTVSYIIYTLLKSEGIAPSWVAGHSLGEYTALVAAGALTFKDALSLVRRRAELMGQVPGEGGMAAVLNTPREVLEELVSDLVSEGPLELANHNSPSQIVVSGEKTLVIRLVERINKEKLGKAILLEVSGAFHSRLMLPAAEEFRKDLDNIKFAPLSVPLIANVSAKEVNSPDELPDLLERQIYSPVLWEESLRNLEALGCGSFLEAGGKVLTGLVKKTLKGVDTYNVIEMDDFKKVLAILKEV